MKVSYFIVLAVLLYFFLPANSCSSQVIPFPAIDDSLVVELSSGVYKVGSVTLDKNDRLVKVPGA